MLLEESRNHIGSKSEGNTTVVFAPTSNVLVGVRPQQITEEAAIRNLFVVSDTCSLYKVPFSEVNIRQSGA